MGSAVFAAKGAGWVAARVGQPRVSVEMAVGLMLGAWAFSRPGLESLGPFASGHSLAGALRHASRLIGTLGTVSVTAYLLTIGLVTGSQRLAGGWTAAGRFAASFCVVGAGLAGVVAVAVGPGVLRPADLSPWSYWLVATAVLSVNGLPIIARLVSDHGSIDRSLAALALAGGLLINLVTFVALRTGDLLHDGRLAPGAAVLGAVALATAAALVALVGRGRSHAPGAPTRNLLIVAAAVPACLATHLLMGTWVIGGFAAGLFLARRATVSPDAPARAAAWLGTWALPVYFTAAGRGLGSTDLDGSDPKLLALVAVGVSVAGFAAAWAAARSAGMSNARARTLSDMGGCRGIVIIIVGMQAEQARLIGSSLLLCLVVVGVATTWLAGRLLEVRGAG